MTCIVAIQDNGAIHMGTDSMGSTHYFKVQRTDPKIFIRDKFIFGFCGSFRMGQLLRFKLQIPKTSKNQNDYEYMCTSFIDSIRNCFAENGYGTMADRADNVGGTFLVGFNSKMYSIESDFQVGTTDDSFMCCGSGMGYAMGSLFTTERWKDSYSPEQRIQVALEAATAYTPSVGAPFNILKLEK